MGLKKITVVVGNEMAYFGDGKALYGDASKKLLGSKWAKLVAFAEKQEQEREALWVELGLGTYCKQKGK